MGDATRWERRMGVRPMLGALLALAAVTAAVVASGRAPAGGPSPVSAPSSAPVPPAPLTVAYYGCLEGERLGENLDLAPDLSAMTYRVDWWYEVSRRNPEGELYGTRGPLLDCVLAALRAPDDLRARMDGTRVDAGVVAEDWPGMRVEWTFDEWAGIVATFTPKPID